MASVTPHTPYETATGDGSTTVVGYGFPILSADDLVVTVNGVQTTAYTLTGVGSNAGGTITFSTAPASGAKIVKYRNSALRRDTEYQYQGDFRADVVNPDFNRIWYVLMEVLNGTRAPGASVRAPIGETIPAMPAVADRASKLLSFDASGNPVAVVPSAQSAASVITALAGTASTAEGAGLSGFAPALNYAASTIGWSVQKANPISAQWYLTGSTTANQAIQAAVNAAVAADWAVIIPGGAEWLITSPITVTGPVQISGMGRGVTRLLVTGCDAFSISAGVSFVTISGMTIANSVRYTTTANTDTAISINGTTATQCYWHTYKDLFIDGFEVGIFAGGLCSSTFRNVTTVYTHQGIDFSGQCLNNSIDQCQLGEQDNNVTVPAAGGFGIRVGDGTINCEGLSVTSTLIYGTKRGIHVRSSINVNVSDCIIDMVHEFGILAISTAGAGCFNNQFRGNYIGITGSAGDTGIYLANGYAATDAQNRGTVVRDNEILAYPGATLNYGILCDGAEEERNTIDGNRIQNTSVWDCRITAGSGHRLNENLWRSTNGFSCTVPVAYGSQNVGAVSGPSLTYGASMTPDTSLFQDFVITANNGTAFTINAPTNDSLRNEKDWRLTFTIRNTSGGALGTATWNATYKLATWTQPANGFSRSIEFRWNGTNYVEVARTPADVPN